MIIMHKLKNYVIIGIALFLLTTYPIYRNLQYGVAYSHYDRHQEWLRGESMFFNPWQYRILCPLLIEIGYQVYTNTIDKLIPVSKVFPNKTPEIVRYYIIFIGFRAFLHFLIFIFCIRFYHHFIFNKWLIYFGLSFLALSMGNAVFDSDFSFNIYIDVILYLAMGIIIVEKKLPWWILLITVLGSLNRETSLLIPFFFWFSFAYKKGSSIQLPPLFINIIAGLSLVAFIIIFFLIRWHFGYQEPVLYGAPVGFPMLLLNLFSYKGIFTYFEVFGTVSILPLWCIYWFRKSSLLLQKLFITLVPIWFLMHFTLAVGWESRLFLVPTTLIFLPIALETLEKIYLSASYNIHH